MNHSPKNSHKAESLIEAIVTITVIVFSTIAAQSVIRSAQAGNEVIGKRTIALDLALEGIEALRDLRQTNYLLFASDPDECWDKLEVTDVAACSAATQITDGLEYYLTRDFADDPMFKWHLTELTDAAAEGYLDLYDIDLDGDGDGESQMYAQSDITTVSDMSTVNSKLFQRIISIDYPTGEDYYNATVIIHWYDHGIEQTLSLTRAITHVY